MDEMGASSREAGEHSAKPLPRHISGWIFMQTSALKLFTGITSSFSLLPSFLLTVPALVPTSFASLLGGFPGASFYLISFQTCSPASKQLSYPAQQVTIVSITKKISSQESKSSWHLCFFPPSQPIEGSQDL